MYEVPDQTGRRIIITGANSGTGKEATRRLAAAGATMVMAVRTPEKGEAVRDEILTDFPDAQLEVRHIDLADLRSVRDFAASIEADGHTVDVLLNNAGVMAPPKRIATADGHELQFGSNFLGPFALTNLLMPTLLKSDRPRVVTMSSIFANFGSIHFDDLDWNNGYRPGPAYNQSKLADMLMGRRLARVARERRWNLLSMVAHPGYTRTNLVTSGANLGREKPKQQLFGGRTIVPSQAVETGAEPLLYAASSPDVEQGQYYGPGGLFELVGPPKVARVPRNGRDDQVADSLWSIAEELTNTKLDV